VQSARAVDRSIALRKIAAPLGTAALFTQQSRADHRFSETQTLNHGELLRHRGAFEPLDLRQRRLEPYAISHRDAFVDLNFIAPILERLRNAKQRNRLAPLHDARGDMPRCPFRNI
jgi:hypothetical protein